jgi:metallophosphoesterase superfamily enzyme
VPQISWQERDEIPYFLESLAEHAQIDIFPGNHDGGIEHLVPRRPDIRIHPVRGSVIEGVAYFHGHTWPDPSLLSAQYIVTAHNHPTIRFTDSLGYSVTEQSWIRTKLNMDVLGEHFRDSGMQLRKGKDVPELIIIPSFNELCGGVAFNEYLDDDLLGPLFSSGAVDIDNAQVYLLDGTCLGALRHVRKLEESRPGTGKRKRKVIKK